MLLTISCPPTYARGRFSAVKQKAGFKPQSAHVYVVEPDSLYFTIDRGNNWVLQTDVDYRIHVKLLDQQGNSVFIPDVSLSWTFTFIHSLFRMRVSRRS